MKWFRRKRKTDDFEKKYEDLDISALFEGVNNDNTNPRVYLEQEPLFINNKEQVRQFVENNCEKIKEATKKVDETKSEYHLVNNYLSDIQMLESMPEQNYKKVLDCAKRVVVLNQDRIDFGKSMTKMSTKQFNQLRDCGDNIKEVLKNLKRDEDYCQNVKTDMNNLEGEKLALRYEKRDMNERIYLVRGISKIAVFAFAALIIMLIIIQMNTEKNLELYAYILVGVAAIGATVLFSIHNHVVRKLKYIEARMNRAIALLNKVKLRYINVQARIEYTYEKFGIHTSYELNKLWGMYLKMVKEREVYHKASDKLCEAEDELAAELKKYSIGDVDVWISQASALINQKEMEQIKMDLCNRRQKLRMNIEYNNEVIEKSGEAIKNLLKSNKEYADEIMNIVEQYS